MREKTLIFGGIMKVFFSRYGYSIVKMFLYQFAISLFGTSLAMSTIATQNKTLTVIVSIFSVLFYLFLLYVLVWDIGAQDKVSVDVGKKEYKPFTGILLSLVANALNFVNAILCSLLSLLALLGAEGSGKALSVITMLYRVVFEGMYLGLITQLNIADKWWTYFIIIIPSIITTAIAYYLGHKNIHFTSVVLYQDPKSKKK